MNNFFKDMIERAIKTAAETAIATIGTTTLLNEINWKIVGSTVAVSTLLSILTSIISKPIGNKNTAGIIKNKYKIKY